MSSVNGFISIHTLTKCKELSSFNEINLDVGNVYISGWHGSMNKHNLYQQNGLISLINSNNSDDIEMNADLNICECEFCNWFNKQPHSIPL